MNDPVVRITSLYEKTSQKGNRHFVGRLGGTRLLMSANQGKRQDSQECSELHASFCTWRS